MQTLDQAMRSLVEWKDRTEMMAYLKDRFDFWEPDESNVTHEPYSGLDKRTGWDTWLVCVRGHAAMFTDGGFTDARGVSSSPTAE